MTKQESFLAWIRQESGLANLSVDDWVKLYNALTPEQIAASLKPPMTTWQRLEAWLKANARNAYVKYAGSSLLGGFGVDLSVVGDEVYSGFGATLELAVAAALDAAGAEKGE